MDDLLKQPPSVQNEILEEITAATNHEYAGSFFCNVLGCMITTPCRADSCNYHVSTGRTEFNCLMKHKFDKGSDVMSVDVIAHITDIPESRIRSSIERAFNKIRSNTLLAEINAGKHNRFTYFQGARVCVVCGNLTPKKSFSVDNRSELYYCSRGCYKRKPPSLVRLEMFYHADIRVVLMAARKVLKRLPMIANTLDVKRRILVKWFDEFLGVHPSVFGSDAVEFVDIMRRTTPKHSWSLEFLSNSFNKPGTLTNQRMLDLEAEGKKLCSSL